MVSGKSTFPRSRRLSSSADFARVFAKAARSSDRYFTLLARPDDAAAPRLGLAISRRAANRSVDRNKLKRIAREAFRLQQDLPPWDYVVMAKPGAAAASKATLRKSLDKHFKRIARRGRA